MPAFTILTDSAQQKLQEAQTTGVAVTLTTFVVGDGGGFEVTPEATQTALVNQVFSAPLNSLTVDQQTGYLYARGIIPADEGGFTVREVGILDSDGELFAVGKTRNIEKPSVGESDISEVVIDIITDITNAELVEIQIDPSVVLATLADIDQRGLPPGGLTDYVLKKSSNQDYDAEWFDPAAGLNINVLAVVESVTLADSQTVVTFNTVGTAGVAVYIEGAREFGFTVDSPTQITLDTSYPAGTQLWAVQNEPAGTISAAAIAFTDTNNRFGAATDVQDVIDQLGEASKRAVGTSTGNLQQVGAFGGPTGAQTYWHSGNFTPGDYVEFAEFSTFGYDFIQAANAAAGRTLLNLGSAATRDVGTSNGQLMEVGAGGLLGNVVIHPTLPDFSALAPSGAYYAPSNSSGGGSFALHFRYTSTIGAFRLSNTPYENQFYLHSTDRSDKTSLNPPVEIWHTGNLSPVTTNTTQTITAEKKFSSPDFGSTLSVECTGVGALTAAVTYKFNSTVIGRAGFNNNGSFQVFPNTSTTPVFDITSQGEVVCESLNTRTTSDQRLKHNIRRVEVDYDKLDKLYLVRGFYNSLAGEGLEGQAFIGGIAQRIKEVFPHCVGVKPHDTLGESYTVDYPKLALAVALAELQRPLRYRMKRLFRQLWQALGGA